MDKNIGKKLDGRYEITELIGVGGMADVYKAIDVTDNRVVAVKILKNEFADDEDFLRKFRNESKAIAVLSHPNIIKIFDVGFTDKIQFIVMEYIDGITLKEFMEQQGILKWKDTIHFIIQILKALQHAHDRGIVHRDIKPQNIMLFPDGTIKVMDFGIARFARDGGKTLTDKTIGSVHYISPEQARGDITDERSDIYSVGVMMYEMLTGEKPFDAQDPVSVALMHMQSLAKPLREVNPDVPEGLAEIVMRAMQKDPQKRYQSASAMIKDIEEFKRDPSIVFEYKYLSPQVSDDTRYFEPVTAPRKKRYEPVETTSNKRIQNVKKHNYEPYDDDDEDIEEEHSSRSLILPILVAVAAAVIIISAFFITNVLIKTFESSKNPDITIPNLVGMDYNEAAEKYNGQFEFDVTMDYSQYDKNIIYEQSEDEGNKVKKGTKITVGVSKGIRMVDIPDVYGMASAKAQQILDEAGFDIVVTRRVDDTTKDFVIKTSPERNTAATPGSTVTLYVSEGPELEEVIMPDVMGKTKEEAEKILMEKKLVPKFEDADSPVEAGKVCEQSVKPDEIVISTSEVIIKISTGNTPVQTFRLPIPITQGSVGGYTFNAYINGNIVGSETKDNVAYVSAVEVAVTGSGIQDVIIEVQYSETGGLATLAKYTVDFTTGECTELFYDEYAFVNAKSTGVQQTEPTPPINDPAQNGEQGVLGINGMLIV